MIFYISKPAATSALSLPRPLGPELETGSRAPEVHNSHTNPTKPPKGREKPRCCSVPAAELRGALGGVGLSLLPVSPCPPPGAVSLLAGLSPCSPSRRPGGSAEPRGALRGPALVRREPAAAAAPAASPSPALPRICSIRQLGMLGREGGVDPLIKVMRN